METQLAGLTPQNFIDLAVKRNLTVDIQYAEADLQGTGHFDFVVAGYETGLLGTIRTFQVVRRGKLALVGDPEGDPDLGGGRMEIELVDIEGSGKPDIAVRSFGATATFTLAVFRWTGSSLRLLNPDPSGTVGTFGGAELFDADNDGVLEIITPSSAQWVADPNKPALQDTPFGIYKFNGTSFTFASTSATDPTGRIGQNGNSQTVFGRSVVDPSEFDLRQIRESHEKRRWEEEDEVTLRLGNLNLPVGSNPGSRSVNDLDLQSLTLGRNIHVLKATIVRSRDDDSADEGRYEGHSRDAKESSQNKFHGPFVQAKFSKQLLLEYLPHAQLTKRLQTGDTLKLDVRGKMKDGAPLFATVTVKIGGDWDDHYRDERGD